MGDRKKISRIRERFKRLPMRWKMSLAYAVPVMLIVVLVVNASFSIFQYRYRRQLEESVRHESRQSVRLIEAYLTNLDYVLEQGVRSAEVRSVMEEADFGVKSSAVEDFWEFERLEAAFSRLEVENSNIRLGLYLPDRFSYTNNRTHFYPMSDLTNRTDYGTIEESLHTKGKSYLFLDEVVYGGTTSFTIRFFTCLMPFTVENEAGGRTGYIMKSQISENLLRSALEGATSLEGDITLLLDENDTILTGNNDERVDLFKEELPSSLKATDWSYVTMFGNEYYTVSDELSENDWRVISFIPVSRFRAQYGFIFFLLIVAVTSLLLTIGAVSMMLARYYAGRIGRLNSKMINVQEGSVNTRVSGDVDYGSRDEMDELYRNFDYMIEEIRRLMKEEYQLGRNVSRAEMRALQAQINPHFLYNTLDLINWGAKDYGAESVAKIARDLGLYYRLSLNHGRSVISLGDELRHIEAFVRIENVHYEDAITLTIDVPEELKSYGFINTVLQPIVENSIVHGIAEHADMETCAILIRAYLENEDLIVEVTDDGKGMDEETAKRIVVYDPKAKGHGYGIANTNFRLRLCYGEKYGITYKPAEPHGTCAVVRVMALSEEALSKLIEGGAEI